jgi:putative hydrolase of the HAD superfamily
VRHVWLFDLDDTLHDASAHIFPHINRAMTHFVASELELDEAEADALRTRYWHRYGATLLGLSKHHGVDPHEFLKRTHDFPDLAAMVRIEGPLKHLLRHLPGRKVVLTNGPRHYAKAVLGLLGVAASIDALIAIEDLRFVPKPIPRAFHRAMRALRVRPRQCTLIEDSAVNLRTAKRLGMRTVLITRHPQRVERSKSFADLRVRSIREMMRLPARLSTTR